ncbi:DNA translocase FtsK 4TM domain-containing protein [Alphaproteobacteria bacterium]|nr:DNA translocase FtsK 4TM domain-containing protein [Alphaproteobacteria bacterium]
MSNHQSQASPIKQALTLFYRKFFALSLLGAAFFMSVALLTDYPWDPSFNTATTTAPQNILGFSGAYIADLLRQSIGYAAWSLIALCFFWARDAWRSPAGRLTLKRGFLLGLLSLCLLTTLTQAIQALTFDIKGIFPLGDMFSAWGGVFGSLMNQSLNGLIPDNFALSGQWIFIGILTPLWAVSFYFAAGLKGADILWASSKTFQGMLTAAQSTQWFYQKLAQHLRSEKETPQPYDDIELSSPADHDDRSPAFDEDLAPEPQEDFSSPPVTQSPPLATPPLGAQMELRAKTEEGLLPPIDLLSKIKNSKNTVSQKELSAQSDRLGQVLKDFSIRGDLTTSRPGPVVTLHEFVPAAGVKSSRVIALADDIARSMSALSTRVSVIAGQNAMGIELPNKTRDAVGLRTLIESRTSQENAADLPLALGCDIGGQPIIADLARMPHLLVAGTTGSGKSVAINTMILSLLYRLPPEKCKFIMIDPKMLELSVYNGIPHLLSPVVTEPKKAVVALKWVVREMEERYRAMSQLSVRNIHNYNTRLKEAAEKGEDLTRRVQTGVDPDSGKPVFETQSLALQHLPFIVVIVDEMADLMLVAGKDVEAAIQRLAQMARAAGIHLIMATQRPSVDVITGTIKANFPTRISFQVTSKIDSRTILGEPGAEQLLGKGDMLYMAGGGRITRVHGPFVSDQEVEAVVSNLSSRGAPDYVTGMTEERDGTSGDNGSGNKSGDRDPLYDKVVELLAREKKASTSFIQRHFQIGYNRAARIVDQLEEDGVISPANHVGRREVLLPETQRTG